jgi:hypothetical protein
MCFQRIVEELSFTGHTMIQATLYEEKKKWISYQNIARSLA